MQPTTFKRTLGAAFTLVMMALPLWAIYFYRDDNTLWGRFAIFACVLIAGCMFKNGIRMWQTADGSRR